MLRLSTVLHHITILSSKIFCLQLLNFTYFFYLKKKDASGTKGVWHNNKFYGSVGRRYDLHVNQREAPLIFGTKYFKNMEYISSIAQ